MRTAYRSRKGNVLIFSLILMIPLLAMLAFAVDVGYMNVTRTELQRTADAAAVAAAWRLMDETALQGNENPTELVGRVRANAISYAALNPVTGTGPQVRTEDVEVGYLANPADPNESIQEGVNGAYNAVRVVVRRDDVLNGQVPLFFAHVLGFDQAAFRAEATAVLLSNVSGFSAPRSGENLMILPFALDIDTWNSLLAGNGQDQYRYTTAESGGVFSGSDGILEVNLFPQNTGAPGNRGTVDIGSSNNSTADLKRQITEGISAEDLEHHGGKLELDSNGELQLNGDTGISAGTQNSLKAIIGETRIIPLFESVTGPGNNAQYTITGFAGVRVMYVNLNGSMNKKALIVQPAPVVAEGAHFSNGPTISSFVYSPAWLVR